MNINDLGTQLLYTTVPIWVEYNNTNKGTGTGFIYMFPSENAEGGSIPLLVTSKHVVENAKRILIEFAEGDGEKPIVGKSFKVEVEGEFIKQFHNSEHDLSAIPVGPILNQIVSQNKNIFFRSITPDLVPKSEVIQELSAIEEITFIGYPSGLFDEHNISPIVRKGITATPPWNNYKGEPVFLIDAGVYPGSSGSPVFIMNQGSFATKEGLSVGNRLMFLGMISETIIRRENNHQNVFLGLGKVIKSSIVKNFIDGLARKLTIEQKS